MPAAGAENFSSYYADKFLTSMIQFSGVSNNFLTPDGYVPYTGYKGFTGVEDWSAQWRHGPIRSTDVTLVPIMWWQEDGSQYFRGIQAAYNVETRSDWRMEMDYVHMQFLDTTDSTIGFNIVKGATNRFRQFGLQFSTGELGSVPFRDNLRADDDAARPKETFDLAYTGFCCRTERALTQQHVLTANYELSLHPVFRRPGGGPEFGHERLLLLSQLRRSRHRVLFDPRRSQCDSKMVRSIQAKFVFSI